LTDKQKEKAVIALRKIQTEKDIKVFKLHEYYKCQRLALLLRIPFSIIKQHVSTRAYVAENGLLGLEMSQEIPINKYLQRDSKDTFEKWLEVNYPQEFARYERDPFKFRFGSNTALVFTDECQRLIDQYDRDCWCKNEEERRYFFSSLLDGVDIDSMDEFSLFGTGNNGSHTAQEIADFKAELLDMQAAYLQHPDAFFHPSDDLIAAHASGSDTVSGERASPTDAGEGVSYKDMEKMRKNKQI
jgi:hypothetical protein